MDLETAREMLDNSNRNLELAQQRLKIANRFLAFSYFLLFIAGVNLIVAIYGITIHSQIIPMYSIPISVVVVIGSYYSRYKTNKILKK